jgi:hypothetical protein
MPFVFPSESAFAFVGILKYIQVGGKKVLPCRDLAALGRGSDTMATEYIPHRLIGHLMTHRQARLYDPENLSHSIIDMEPVRTDPASGLMERYPVWQDDPAAASVHEALVDVRLKAATKPPARNSAAAMNPSRARRPWPTRSTTRPSTRPSRPSSESKRAGGKNLGPSWPISKRLVHRRDFASVTRRKRWSVVGCHPGPHPGWAGHFL